MNNDPLPVGRVRCTCGQPFIDVAEWRKHRESKIAGLTFQVTIHRRWWQFWKPKTETTSNPEAFTTLKRHSSYSVNL